MVFASNMDEDSEAKRINKEIESELRKVRKANNNMCKMLLLGTGDSGKSTMAKQMKIIHLSGFTEEECEIYKRAIINNIVEQMQLILNKGLPHCCCYLPDDKTKHADVVNSVEVPPDNTGAISLTPSLIEAISILWKDETIQTAFKRGYEFQLQDSAGYFFTAFDRVSDSEYNPTTMDLLRVRVKTTGIVEIDWNLAGTHFKMIDVGGQRNERKKWIHCFQEVTAVLFCVALSEYDQQLVEDTEVNRMEESLRLFSELVNSTWFSETNVILFLNKKDLFEEKIKRVDLCVCFPSYDGGNDFEKASLYIEEKFLQKNDYTDRQIYSHLTCATDTENIKFVFVAVRDIVLTQAIKETGVGF